MGDHRDSDIGRRQAEIRKRLGLTQFQMADRLGIPLRTLSDNERGVSTPGGKVLQTYATLGISVDWMITGEGRPFREGTSVGAVDLAELHGATRIAIAVFDETDVLESYIVSSEERHRRARISLSPEIVDEMVPVRELGLPDECRLFGFHDSNRDSLTFIDGAKREVSVDRHYLLSVNEIAEVRRVQALNDDSVAVFLPDGDNRIDFVATIQSLKVLGAVVGRLQLEDRKPA